MPSIFRLKKNLITKKTSKLNTNNNCYCFIVDNDANKIDLKKNIEKYFSVKVKSVNTIGVMTKMKRKYPSNGVIFKKSTNIKKAYVCLEKGEQLDFNNFVK